MTILRSFTRYSAVLAVAWTASAGAAGAQSTLEDVLRQLNSSNSRGYLQPLADVLAADLAAGWFSSAMLPREGLGFGLELVAMGTSIADKHLTYTATAPEGFPQSSFTTATVFGGTGTTVQGPSGTSFRGSDGLITAEYMPAAVPQLRLGMAGTEAIVRYFSTSLVSALPEEDFPTTTLLGVGVRHSISQYFDAIPVDLSAGVFYSKFDIGEESSTGVDAKFSGLSFGVQASKTFSVLTLYTGLASDGGSMTLGYLPNDPDVDERIEVDIDVDRSIKFSIGSALRFGFLRIFADANFGSATTYSGGLRIGM